VHMDERIRNVKDEIQRRIRGNRTDGMKRKSKSDREQSKSKANKEIVEKQIQTSDTALLLRPRSNNTLIIHQIRKGVNDLS